MPLKLAQSLVSTVRVIYRAEAKLTLLTGLVSLLEALTAPLLLLALSRLIQSVLSVLSTTDGSYGSPLQFAGWCAAIIVLQAALSLARDLLATILRTAASQAVVSEVLEKVAGTPYRLFENKEFQGRFGLTVQQASFRSGMIIDSVISTAAATLMFISVLLTLAVVAPVLLLVVLAVIVLASVEIAFSGKTVSLQTSAAPDLMRMEYLTFKSIDPVWQRDLRVYRSSILLDEYRRLGRRYLSDLRRLSVGFARWRLLAVLATGIIVGGAVYWLLALLRNGTLDLPTLSVLLPGLYLGLTQGRSLAVSGSGLVEGLGYANVLREFLGFKVEDESAGHGRLHLDANGVQPAVRLDAVCYQYPEATAPALRDVSLVLRPGTTAIVGPNGAGKSTLVKLLTGLLDPTSGHIGIKGISATVWAAVFQEPAHFHLTIRENITLRSDDRSGSRDNDDVVWEILRRVGLEAVVRGMERGLDTLAGAGFGVDRDLSGGQWQRLALARLIYFDSPLIVLDEPVSSLDPSGEREAFSLLREFAKERIVVLTTHRYDSLQANDRIIHIVDGEVVEDGSHADLIARRAGYFDLVKNKGERRSGQEQGS